VKDDHPSNVLKAVELLKCYGQDLVCCFIPPAPAPDVTPCGEPAQWLVQWRGTKTRMPYCAICIHRYDSAWDNYECEILDLNGVPQARRIPEVDDG